MIRGLARNNLCLVQDVAKGVLRIGRCSDGVWDGQKDEFEKFEAESLMR
jgi:hypothetical protein